MKLKNGEIYNARDPLQKLMEQKFPVKISYGLAKLANKLNPELKAIEDVKNGLIRKYGASDEKGNVSVKPEQENWGKFIDEFAELMETDVEVVFEKVKISDTGLEIEPSILMALEKFIEV